ncbi:MAG: GDSL-type esterase/lipase family protein [Armatimonadota bacterium]|nr:GDSL-type esterase/lipase family protein [Armatimonadota bacterium]
MNLIDPTQPEANVWPDDPDAWTRLTRSLAADAHAANPRVVFLGDSITQDWGGSGKAEWEARFAPFGAANLGIGGDRTQNILWRIADGALDGLAPDLVVLKIGVNNLWEEVQRCGVEKVADGVAACVAAIREKCPKAKILALGILPTQADPSHSLREIVRAVNARSAASLPTPNGQVRFADISEVFLEADGTISTEIMPDGCHLSPRGYQIFADALEPIVQDMLNTP